MKTDPWLDQYFSVAKGGKEKQEEK